MHLVVTILVFLLILSVLVLGHEFGHYYFAKRAGVRVDEFGFGLPPRLWGKKIGDTLWSINLLPFGGFVRLFGEDPRQPGAMNNPSSYNSKSLLQRFWIVTAGVIMNILMAIVFLTVGFWIGIKPLLIDSHDILQAIEEKQLVIQSGYVIQSVTPGSLAERTGIQQNDILVELNGKGIIDESLLAQALKRAKDFGMMLKVRRGDSVLNFNITKDKFEAKELGIAVYDSFLLPRLVIRSVEPQSEVAKAGLKSGDMLLAVNDQPVYNLEDYQAFFLTARTLRVTYQRHYKEYQTTVNFPERRSVTVTEVIPGSNAEKAELQKGDTILQVERSDVASPEEVIVRLAAAKNAGKPAQLLVERGKSLFTAYVSAGADGTYGLQVSPIINQNLGVVLVATSSPTSVLELKPVSYGFFSSIRMAFTETGRLAKATLAMFGNLFSKLFSSLEVPEGVSGPVGIAQMTGIFVKEGFLSLLRFMALLSLSLGVLNLLPFPGLDGGRLLFILIEGVLGRPVNRKIEQLVHAFGAILLILIIAVVTYKDIVRIL